MLGFSFDMASGAGFDDLTWKILETRHAIVRYQTLDDLKDLDRRLKYKVEGFRLTGLFSASSADDRITLLKEKIDALFEKAQAILDMRKKMEKITINIYQNKAQLKDAYKKIYMRPCNIRAWYEFRFNSIYINVDDVHEGMLAHEMAHGIIDHYLLVRPPTATAEILARYVDSHLKR